MDKSMYNMKAEKIQNQVKNGDYQTAAKICDGIDWSEVKSPRMLSLVSSVYEHVHNYEKAIDILTMAYEEAPVGRRFLRKLTELALAAGNIREAEEYYKNYVQEADGDNYRYILRYQIAEAKHEPLDKRITILEAYKKQEFDEQWAYRLAELYDQAGNADRCVKLCDEIVLWFGVGPYVDKALTLKEKYQPLTEDQKAHRENREYYEDNLRKVQQESTTFRDINLLAKPASSGYEEESGAGRGDNLSRVVISGPESGQAVTEFDMSVFEEDRDGIDQQEEDEALSQTRRINDKEDFSRTRVFEKLPVDTTEMQLFRTVTSEPQRQQRIEQPAPAAPHVETQQLAFDWSGVTEPELSEGAAIEEFAMPDNTIYIEADTPAEGLEAAVDAIKEVHAEIGTPIVGVAKITGTKLNQKGLISSLSALRGKDIIIMGASSMEDAIVDELKKVKDEIEPDRFYVLADSPKGIAAIKDRILNPHTRVTVSSEPEIVVPSETYQPAEPAYEEPAFNQPEEPAYEQPAFEQPAETAYEQPAYEQPAFAFEQTSIPEPEPEPAPAPAPVEEEPDNQDEFVFSFDEAGKYSEPVPQPEPVKPAYVPAEEPAYTEEEAYEEPEAEEDDIEISYEEEEPEQFEEEPERIIRRRTSVNTDGQLSPEAFVKAMLAYMKEIDCVPEEGLAEALIEFAEQLQEDGEFLDEVLASKEVEAAADEAEKFSLGNMFHSRYDKKGCLILRPKHFI